MLRSLAISALGITSLILPAGSLANDWVNVQSAVYHPGSHSNVEYSNVVATRHYHRRHPTRKTVKRVGIGAGGGAAVGALLGGGKGAAIGALAGGGAGAVYDHHEKKKGN